MKTRRETILGVVADLVGELMYYGRKECEALPYGAIESAVAAGEISVDEMITHFAAELRKVRPLDSAERARKERAE